MTRTVAFLPGDGIGPEVLGAARRVLDAVGFRAEYVEAAVGWGCWQRDGNALPGATLDLCRRADAVWFGAITSLPEPEAQDHLPAALRGRVRYESPIVRLRRELDLFANVRPSRSLAGAPRAREGVDLVVVRENTEGLYSGVEFRPLPEGVRAAFRSASPAWSRFDAETDVAVSARVVTRRGVERAAREAFRRAQRRRRRVTLVEKANVLRATGGLVVEATRRVAAEFPDVALDLMAVDAACMDLVRRPGRFDVVLATNLFGDILSDVAAEVTGGLGLAASANLGERHALFEPVHGSAPDLAPGTANPLAAILSGAMLAEHLGEGGAADAVRRAVADVVANGPRTRDMGGEAGTRTVADAVAGRARLFVAGGARTV